MLRPGVSRSFIRRQRHPIAVLLAASFAVSCSNPFMQGDCISIGVAGINATVVDATTNRAPTSVPSLRIEDGTYVEDNLTPFSLLDPPQLSGAFERPGTYRIVVRAEGYQDYVQENIRVTRGGHCNYLKGVRLNIQLVRKM